ncbi:MAG: GCN5-related N-acetyltransferase [uncultured bacterium]|nr:MAG: GCN5-related N-acetyltransferase [uncultured bacterium]
MGGNKTIHCTFIQTPTEDQLRQIVALYRAEGWWSPYDEGRRQLIPRLISGSHCFVVAEEEGRIVGIGRAISDGVSDAYIQDMVVLDAHRKQGIGRRILDTILERLRNDGLRWIGLIAEPGSSSLYQHAGFREITAWAPMLLTIEGK